MSALVHREMRRYDNRMAIFTVHIPPQGELERSRFIREGVNVIALIVPLIWLLWHRLWLGLLVYVAIAIAIGLAGRAVGAAAAVFLSALPGLYLFVEGNQLLRNRLSRSGWSLAGVVEADTAADAELRYFHFHEEGQSVTKPQRSAAGHAPMTPLRPSGDSSGIGIFPE